MDRQERQSSSTVGRSGGRPKARGQGVRGVKMLISSLALMITLAGWARLATGKHTLAGGAVVQATPWAVVASVRVNQTISYRVQPLPTLVPLITPPHASAHRASRPNAVPASPAVGAAALTTLRMVSAPPPPQPQAQSQSQSQSQGSVAVTRSSR